MVGKHGAVVEVVDWVVFEVVDWVVFVWGFWWGFWVGVGAEPSLASRPGVGGVRGGVVDMEVVQDYCFRNLWEKGGWPRAGGKGAGWRGGGGLAWWSISRLDQFLL